jgi:hypothetical protein
VTPSTAAATTTNGNGTAKKNSATNAAAAIATMARLRSARLPMRSSASTTMAITADLRPKNSAVTTVVCCQTA